jgi:hypothetical protein
MNIPGPKITFASIGLLLVVLLAVLVFFLRAPVLLLSDNTFDVLYGPGRISQQRLSLALRLFRPVRVVQIAESAGPEMIEVALKEAVSRPRAVLVPSRYERGARRYAAQFPECPVVITGGFTSALEGNVFTAGTDSRSDAYRAGIAAAIFALKGGGDILVYQDNGDYPLNRERFLAGLKAEGYEGNPIFLQYSQEYISFDRVSCIVLTGQAAAIHEKNLKIPLLLFSWQDPSLSPAQAVLLFDDSVWALAERGIKTAARGEAPGPFPSKVTIKNRNIADNETLRRLKKALAAQIVE